MINRRTFIKSAALAAGGIMLLDFGIFAKDKEKKSKSGIIDANKMKLEITKDGILLFPFKIDSYFCFMNDGKYENKKFPIKSSQKTVGVQNVSMSKNEKGEFVVELLYKGLKAGYQPEIEAQLLDKEKVIINRKNFKLKVNVSWRSYSWSIVTSKKFNFGKIKTNDIKYIGIGAK